MTPTRAGSAGGFEPRGRFTEAGDSILAEIRASEVATVRGRPWPTRGTPCSVSPAVR